MWNLYQSLKCSNGCTCKRFVLLGIFVAWDVETFGAVVLGSAVVVVDALVVIFELELKEKKKI